MGTGWTSERVRALAPDGRTLARAEKLAVVSRWQSLGQTEYAVFGDCRGSAKAPYRVAVDFTSGGTPATSCSCPSRKIPCKHVLALLLVWVDEPEQVPASPLPPAVEEWLAARQERAAAREAKAAAQAASAPDPEAVARRHAARVAKVDAGIAQLRLWLEDLVDEGLATLAPRGYAPWDAASARLVDAQATGLARWIRRIGGLVGSGPDWPTRLLDELGRLYLLLDAWPQREQLPAALQHDLRALVGWSVPKDEVLAGEGIADRWLCWAVRQYEAAGLETRATYYLGETTGRFALRLDFVPLGGRMPPGPSAGTELEGTLAFYPGSAPERALEQTIGQSRAADLGDARWPTLESTRGLCDRMADELARQPWLIDLAFAIDDVSLRPDADEVWMVDRRGERVLARGPSLWRALAETGGHPTRLFGRWDGYAATILNWCPVA